MYPLYLFAVVIVAVLQSGLWTGEWSNPFFWRPGQNQYALIFVISIVAGGCELWGADSAVFQYDRKDKNKNGGILISKRPQQKQVDEQKERSGPAGCCDGDPHGRSL